MTFMTDYRALKRNLANKELVALAIVYVFIWAIIFQTPLQKLEKIKNYLDLFPETRIAK